MADSIYFKVLAAFAIFSFFASVVPNLGRQQPPGEGFDGQENLSVSGKRFVIPRMTMASAGVNQELKVYPFLSQVKVPCHSITHQPGGDQKPSLDSLPSSPELRP